VFARCPRNAYFCHHTPHLLPAADADFPRFYKAGDAVVLPTRGEGWGRPQVEAMAMGLPVISTNWSGITGAPGESLHVMKCATRSYL
jgi:glycosyltransferase involved in cell wall biosynthesis